MCFPVEFLANLKLRWVVLDNSSTKADANTHLHKNKHIRSFYHHTQKLKSNLLNFFFREVETNAAELIEVFK